MLTRRAAKLALAGLSAVALAFAMWSPSGPSARADDGPREPDVVVVGTPSGMGLQEFAATAPTTRYAATAACRVC